MMQFLFTKSHRNVLSFSIPCLALSVSHSLLQIATNRRKKNQTKYIKFRPIWLLTPEHWVSFANILDVYSSFRNISHWPQNDHLLLFLCEYRNFCYCCCCCCCFIYLLKIKCKICTREFSNWKITYTEQLIRLYWMVMECAVYICFGQLKSRIIIRRKTHELFSNVNLNNKNDNKRAK